MRLLILGGTGFIGPHQVRDALARGHRVAGFNRGRQKEAWAGPGEELLGERNGDLKALEGRDWDVRAGPVAKRSPHHSRAAKIRLQCK
jgi:2'-hydroxyisoflavone reductase